MLLPIKHALVCHPDTPSTAVVALQVSAQFQPQGQLLLRYELTGKLAQLRIPIPQAPTAVDGLWEHTCFEVFVGVEGDDTYHEFNFSPSGQWAAYGFSGYRQRSAWAASQPPAIRVNQLDGQLRMDAQIATADLPKNTGDFMLQLGLTAVVEQVDGSRSYWALHHPEAQPDFHQRAGFILSLNPYPLE
ncbi:MAG: DOMON-like domain-containing protein [Methylococcales bacterium]|nr:DOMON-like domain-containing protein [Methylococcales bacterium]